MHSLWQDYTPSPDYGQLLKALILLGLKVLAEGQRPSEREQLHLPDGPHHQVLRGAVILPSTPTPPAREGLFFSPVRVPGVRLLGIGMAVMPAGSRACMALCLPSVDPGHCPPDDPAIPPLCRWPGELFLAARKIFVSRQASPPLPGQDFPSVCTRCGEFPSFAVRLRVFPSVSLRFNILPAFYMPPAMPCGSR